VPEIYGDTLNNFISPDFKGVVYLSIMANCTAFWLIVQHFLFFYSICGIAG
jgi:hypothetical protein